MAVEIPIEMIAGRLDPYTVAKNTLGRQEITPSQIRELGVSIQSFLNTGVFISNDFGLPVMASMGNNIKEYSRRLAQYNYHLATLAGTDSDLIADVAFTLFQLTENTIENFEEREELFQDFYPFLIERDLAPEHDFLIHFLAVDHYMKLAGKDKKYFNDVITYGTKAVRFSNTSFAKGTAFLCNTLFWLGVAFNETGPKDKDVLKQSIGFLEQCIEIKAHCRGPLLGAVLNSLGYSCLLLGKLTHDRHMLEKAVTSFKSALPLRHDERKKQLTRNNLSIAMQALSGGLSGSDESEYAALLRTIDFVVREFKDAAMKEDAREKTLMIQAGMDALCAISEAIHEENDPCLKARFELIMGLGLLFNGDNPAAVCFLNASRRKWDQMDPLTDLPRKTSAYYNLGLAFAAMEGCYDKNAYVNAAVDKLSHAKALFNELGSLERARSCDMIIEKLVSP